jgi:hypothetical protein
MLRLALIAFVVIVGSFVIVHILFLLDEVEILDGFLQDSGRNGLKCTFSFGIIELMSGYFFNGIFCLETQLLLQQWINRYRVTVGLVREGILLHASKSIIIQK